MEALKWTGYIVAAILVLSVILGVGFTIAAVVIIGGALVSLVLLVLGVASAIKGACTPHNRKRGH